MDAYAPRIERMMKRLYDSLAEDDRRRYAAIEAAKERLSFVPFTSIDLEYHGKKYQREIQRDLFDKLITPIVNRTLGPCRDCIKDAGVTVD